MDVLVCLVAVSGQRGALGLSLVSSTVAGHEGRTIPRRPTGMPCRMAASASIDVDVCVHLRGPELERHASCWIGRRWDSLALGRMGLAAIPRLADHQVPPDPSSVIKNESRLSTRRSPPYIHLVSFARSTFDLHACPLACRAAHLSSPICCPSHRLVPHPPPTSDTTAGRPALDLELALAPRDATRPAPTDIE